jgi:hypothetical protein
LAWAINRSDTFTKKHITEPEIIDIDKINKLSLDFWAMLSTTKKPHLTKKQALLAKVRFTTQAYFPTIVAHQESSH